MDTKIWSTTLLFTKVISLLIVIPLFLFTVPLSYSAGGTISVVPPSGTFADGEKFQAQIRIDGGGTAFNAAKASVNVSENLIIEGVTLGDCGFAFVDTPSVSTLSFAGVILGESATSCNAYSIVLRVSGSNNGYVFISEGSIKAYNGAAEILDKLSNSSYTFVPSTGNNNLTVLKVTPTQQPLMSNEGQKMYRLIYSIPSDKSSQAINLSVVLDLSLPTQMIASISPLPSDPLVLAAVFDNVSEGVHTVDILDGSSKVSSEIVNVEGESREISLGVTPKKTTSTLLMAIIIAVGVIVLISASVIGFVFYTKRTWINP